MAKIPLPVHSYRLNSTTAANSRLINCFAEALPEGKQPARLTRAPGIASFSTPGGGPGRGTHVMNGTLYAISGSTLYSVDSNGAAVSRGNIGSGLPVSMASNSAGELVIGTDGGTWYVWDGATLAAITDNTFTAYGARNCAHIDGYIVFVVASADIAYVGRFFSSDLLDAANYLDLDWATAEGNPDRLISVASDHRELLLFGESSTELWYNSSSAGSGFPFERSPDGFLELGGKAVKGHCQLDNSIVWLASDLTIRRLNGRTPQRISTHGVEERLRGYSVVSDCQAYAYTLNGHLCAVFRFPSAGACWVFDATTGEWHERATYGSGDWKISGISECYGRVLVQSAVDGAIGYMSNSTYTEFGLSQRVEWTYRNVYQNNRRLFHSSLEVACETGVGLRTGQGSNPELTLDVSDDGGRTWDTFPTRTLGGEGEYETRVKWDRLGSARDRIYRCSISDPVELSVTDTLVDVA